MSRSVTAHGGTSRTDKDNWARAAFVRVRRDAWFLGLLWTVCIAASLLWNLYEQQARTFEMARNTAQITYDKDILYRRWAARQGGLYVPVSDHTPPNPFLDVPNRDVVTSSGLAMTLVNPAYMTRQVNEMAESAPGFKAHITSLTPIRPGNAADSWETIALTAFENGAKEMTSVAGIEGCSYLRYMRPMITEKSCLKCHAVQGYQEGDIRGGISVSVPMAPPRATQSPLTSAVALAHLALWIVGLTGILVSRQGLTREVLARGRAEQAASEREELFRLTFEASAVGAALADRDGRFRRVNEALCRLTGYGPAEWKGRGLADIAHPDDREQNLASLRDMVEGRGARLTRDARLIRKDGSTIWVQLEASLVRSATPPYVIAQFSDITERMRAEAEVRRHAEELGAANSELAQFNRVAVDRELRMVELKKEVDELRRRAGEPPRYSPDAEA